MFFAKDFDTNLAWRAIKPHLYVPDDDFLRMLMQKEGASRADVTEKTQFRWNFEAELRHW